MFPSRRRSIAALVLCLLLPAVLLAGAYAAASAARRAAEHIPWDHVDAIRLTARIGDDVFFEQALADPDAVPAPVRQVQLSLQPAEERLQWHSPLRQMTFVSEGKTQFTLSLFDLSDPSDASLGAEMVLLTRRGAIRHTAFFRIPDPAQQLELLLSFVSVPAVTRAECNVDGPDGQRRAVCTAEQARALLGAIHLLTDTLRGMPDYGWDKSRAQQRYTARFSGPDGQETAYELLLTEPGKQAALLRRDGEKTRLYLFSGAAVQARLKFAFEQALDAGAAP